MGDGLFIVVEAIIGAGKSTFAKHLVSTLKEEGHVNPEIQKEPVEDNPFLQKFYKDMKRWAYTMQAHLLHFRFRKHQDAVFSDHSVVQDRSLYGDVCFANLAHKLGNMDSDEIASYHMARRNMMNFMVYPDLMIYLDISPEQAYRRIKKRARGCESGISLDYLKGLNDEYQDMTSKISKHCPVFRVAWSDFSDRQIKMRVKDTWQVAKQHVKADWVTRGN